jgi:hypothetical protein
VSEGLERDDSKILVCRAVDKNELWADVFGSGWEYSPWWISVDFTNGDWEEHGEAVIKYLDPDDADEQQTATKTVTITDLANACSKLETQGWTHCGGEGLSDPDACTSDAVLQVAVFGELVYG